jgi:hypothetical protein
MCSCWSGREVERTTGFFTLPKAEPTHRKLIRAAATTCGGSFFEPIRDDRFIPLDSLEREVGDFGCTRQHPFEVFEYERRTE